MPGIPGLNRAEEVLDYRKGDMVSGYEGLGSSLRDLPRSLHGTGTEDYFNTA